MDSIAKSSELCELLCRLIFISNSLWLFESCFLFTPPAHCICLYLCLCVYVFMCDMLMLQVTSQSHFEPFTLRYFKVSSIERKKKEEERKHRYFGTWIRTKSVYYNANKLHFNSFRHILNTLQNDFRLFEHHLVQYLAHDCTHRTVKSAFVLIHSITQFFSKCLGERVRAHNA